MTRAIGCRGGGGTDPTGTLRKIALLRCPALATTGGMTARVTAVPVTTETPATEEEDTTALGTNDRPDDLQISRLTARGSGRTAASVRA
jgi:hypothetical protein